MTRTKPSRDESEVGVIELRTVEPCSMGKSPVCRDDEWGFAKKQQMRVLTLVDGDRGAGVIHEWEFEKVES